MPVYLLVPAILPNKGYYAPANNLLRYQSHAGGRTPDLVVKHGQARTFTVVGGQLSLVEPCRLSRPVSGHILEFVRRYEVVCCKPLVVFSIFFLSFFV